METSFAATRDILLRRLGLVFVEPGGAALGEHELRAADMELAAVGYMPSARLRARLATLPVAELGRRVRALTTALAAQVGGGQRHEPLFRRFPEDVPKDTFDLYVRKVLCHFLQAEGQPCLFCRRVGTTHVLRPCLHVVCDRCFDGSNYSACPVCEHHVDRSSPFFKPGGFLQFKLPKEKIAFKLLDLGDDLQAQAEALLRSFCERKQAMSPVDGTDLVTLVGEFGDRVLAWLPEKIAVRENVAQVFGVLLRSCDPAATLAAARRHLATATDLLRLIAVYSGADPSLQGELVRRTVKRPAPGAKPDPLTGKLLAIVGGEPPPPLREVPIKVRIYRFKVGRLGRPLRRALRGFLESLHPDGLIEDMLRHRSYWVWLGELLHPHEHAKTCPNVARAFAVVRKQAPDGTPAPKFVGYYGALEAAARAGDAARMVDLLQARPGELARRFDHTLRVAGDDPRAQQLVLAGFAAAAPRFANPVLLTLRSVLPARARPWPIRVFWPKGQVAKGTSAPDTRAPLAPDVIAAAGHTVEAELLRRFAGKPGFDLCVVDEALRGIVVPFNERTASRSAVALPRGSQIPLPAGKVVRLFLHWCEPEQGGRTTDIDLSVGFYDADWKHVAVCSYYSLRLDDDGRPIARSSGDLRSAPFPDGASEFVDLHREHALRRGLRYAVMVVNNYAGMSFSKLERGFAGMMLREDLGGARETSPKGAGSPVLEGAHFDPRTVELKFDLQGDNGVFMPLVLDIAESRIHWLDVYSKGQLAFNNVQSSNAAITKICPEMIAYFASGARLSMFDLALLHAAARGQRVLLRGATDRLLARHPGETAEQFLHRLQTGDGARPGALPRPDGPPVFAALYKGDLDLPPGSTCYALFRERVTGVIAASDLVS